MREAEEKIAFPLQRRLTDFFLLFSLAEALLTRQSFVEEKGYLIQTAISIPNYIKVSAVSQVNECSSETLSAVESRVQLEELGYVVEESEGDDGHDVDLRRPRMRDPEERMTHREVSFHGDGHCEEYWAGQSNLKE